MNNDVEHLDQDPTPVSGKAWARVGKLDTIEAVRVELARLYRASRREAGIYPKPNDATKLAYLLHLIGRSLEQSEIVRRLEEIERKVSGQ